jgi:hypothetical protein
MLVLFAKIKYPFDMCVKHTDVFFVLFFSFILAVHVSAAENLSQQAENAIDQFMTLRMNLAAYERPEEALLQIDTYCTGHLSENMIAAFTGEEKLILENFEVLERYNYLYKMKGNERQLKTLLQSQNKKNEKWFTSHKNEVINKWLYCTGADILSCSLSYASVTKILHDGLAVKRYYEKALEQDPSMSYALTNIAQWYYYAPSFGRGSKSKAKKCFDFAVKGARTSAEMYYAKIFLSQYLFEDESKRSESAALLADADSIQPGGHYIKWLRRINKAGYSLYYYNSHKLTSADIDKSIGMI